MSSADIAASLEECLGQLSTPHRILFPVRHHSPACAWHLARLIRERKPSAILVEGPASFTPLIPLLLHEKARAPFAIYTNFIDKDGRLPAPPPEEDRIDFGPPRFAAYYPFCDYSPELVALREGARAGATLRFIDLNYPDQLHAEHAAASSQSAPRVESLLAERHFQRSAYLAALARKSGCRDPNDLWDHLFEAHHQRLPTRRFIRDVAAYCFMTRVEVTAEELQADGTASREAAMTSAIRQSLDARPAGAGPILVVTGGFHTVALPRLLRENPAPPPALAPDAAHVQTALIRYSFDQLDALNGYSAGMPLPFYYDSVWRQSEAGAENPALDTAARALVDIGRRTREKGLAIALSTADEIAALEQARRLAFLRGHPGPTREDLLDGVRSCFVKGAMDAEGAVLMGIAQHVLAGNAIGEVPPEAGVPPIVDDFRSLTRVLRLNISDSLARKLSLDIYRKTTARKASRLLNSLGFLSIPFGRMVAGPDFVRGTGLERLHEHWEYQWSPRTESALIEASVYGATVEEAATNRLVQAIAELEAQGKSRDATAAVGMLIQACRMGLHRHAARLLALIEANLADDPSFASLVGAMNQLLLLWHSREPLEAHQLPEIPQLIRAAYEKACYLARDLARTPAESLDATLDGLGLVRELLAAPAAIADNDAALLDPQLFWPAMEAALAQPSCPPLLAGGAAGILHSTGRLSETDLVTLVAGQLGATTHEVAAKIGFLRGLLRTSREAAWRQPALVQGLEQLFQSWNDEEFLRTLPELRLAFSGFTPRETDQVAAVVAGTLGLRDLGRLVHHEISEGEMLAHAQLTARVAEALRQDHLPHWLEPAAS